ncbi:MAG: hypothetical protein Q7S20_11760 [Gemmatimonadaceae bacterium]|nr:hypothetical protein [Gemmatimonadaceae bacterium]
MQFIRDPNNADRIGFRMGDKGTHTSRTIMLDDLSLTLAAAGPDSRRADFADEIIEHNCLAKTTVATRRLSNQRLGELYALDPGVPLFRVLRHLWRVDEPGRPLLAMLAAIGRDPLLAASAAAILPLAEGDPLDRDQLARVIRAQAGERLSDATAGKVARNVASSWEQSGHLQGRTFKKRRRVGATPHTMAFALYLGHAAGYRGQELLANPWVDVLDCSPTAARQLALEAKRIGLIDLRSAGDVLSIELGRLDPAGIR